MRKTLLALMLFATGAQAAAVQDLQVFRNYNGADAGTLVMSITKQSDQTELTWSELTFRKIDQSVRGSVNLDVGLNASTGDTDEDKLFGFELEGKACGIRINLFSDPGALQDGDRQGKVVTRKLPPGDYEFFQFAGIMPGNADHRCHVARLKFSIPFTIKPGETTYLGEFFVPIKPQAGSRLFFARLIPGIVGYYVQITDKNSRDLEIAARRDPGVKTKVNVSVPDMARLPPVLFAPSPDRRPTSEKAARAFVLGMDLSAEEEHSHLRDPQRHINDLTSAIDAGDLWSFALSVAYTTRASDYLALGQNAAALDDLNKSISIYYPINEESFVLRAAAYRNTKRFDEAIADGTTAIQIVPESARAHSERAISYAMAGRKDLALADIAESIRLQPTDEVAHTERAKAYDALGDADKAISEYTSAINIGRRNNTLRDPVVRERAFLYLATGSNASAVTDFKTIVDMHRATAMDYSARCFALASVNRAREAANDCNITAKTRTSSSDALVWLGHARIKLGQFALAVGAYSAVIQSDAGFASAFYGRGVAKMKMGDVAGAGADMDTAKQLDSGIAEKMANLGITP